MRLLCAGDSHLGAGADYGATPRGPGSRLEDQERVLHRIAKLAIAEKVDGLLWAGDTFHRRRPTPPELMAWRSFVELLGDEGIGIVAVLGNHDMATADEWTGPEVVRGDGYYDVFRRPGTSYAFPGVAIATLPWTPPARLVASRDGGNRDLLHEDVAELLIDTATTMRREIDSPAILLAHWAVSGASTPIGVPAEAFREPVLPLADLEGLGYESIVLGHIHKPQILSPGQLEPDSNGSHHASGHPIFYVGSPNVIDFGEAVCPHGVWILDTEDWSTRFVPIEDRRFLTLDYDASDPLEEAMLQAATAGANIVGGEVVRVRYTATAEQARRIDHAAIRASLLEAGASKVYAIQATVLREDRARVEGLDETSDAPAAMAAWLVSQGIDGERAKELQERGQRYLEEARV
jgi:exonuclease SbcD